MARTGNLPIQNKITCLGCNKEIELLGLKELATASGRDTRFIQKYRDRGLLPEPVAILACGAIWERSQVEAFIQKHRVVKEI